jgi:hypothetical protein
MSKDPAFLFYPGDWDGGTKLFTRAQKGAYIDLLMCQFHNGHMTSHDVGHILGQVDFDSMWESKLKSKFKQDEEGRFFNEKLENEQVKRKNWCNSRKNNKEGNNQYSGHMSKHMKGHMVNENEDVNDNVVSKNIIVKEKKFKRPTVEQVRAYCLETKSTIDPDYFFNNYESQGWIKANGMPIQNWKLTIKTWEKRDNKKPIDSKLKEFMSK